VVVEVYNGCLQSWRDRRRATMRGDVRRAIMIGFKKLDGAVETRCAAAAAARTRHHDQRERASAAARWLLPLETPDSGSRVRGGEQPHSQRAAREQAGGRQTEQKDEGGWQQQKQRGTTTAESRPPCRGERARGQARGSSGGETRCDIAARRRAPCALRRSLAHSSVAPPQEPLE
jgi:hypothetical protein